MESFVKTRVWNYDLPPYPREGLFHLDMSKYCQVNRLLTFEAGRLAQLNQLDVVDNAADLRKFQKKLRGILWKKFGCVYDPSLPLKVKKFGVIRKKDFTVTKLIYQGRPGIFVTALLYVPAGKGPFPAVIQMHGHNPEGKFGINPQAMSLGLVKSGYVCLAVDAFGTYERACECYARQYHGSFLGASIMKGHKVADKVRFLVVPASQEVYLQALHEGLLDIFMEAGAMVMNPNCSVCWGSCQGVIGAGEVLISTGTRNFKGRAGDKNSFVYLGSAATVAASAIAGEIVSPYTY